METKLRKSPIDLTDLAVGIIVLGIVVSIGAVILINFRDSRLTDLSTVTTNNESVTFTGGNTAVLSNKWGIGVSYITNTTGAKAQTLTTDYTVSISDLNGQITITNVTESDDGWNVTYNWYNTSRADWDLANKSAIGLAEYGNWFKIIVIVGVASLVLGLIFLAFGRREGATEGIGGTY